MRSRSIGMCIFLSIITCGIYGIYWFVCLTDDVAFVTQEPGTTGGMAVLFSIVTCGIYTLYWYYKMGEKLDRSRAARGIPAGSLSILYLILGIVGLGIVSMALMQSEVNNYAGFYD